MEPLTASDDGKFGYVAFEAYAEQWQGIILAVVPLHPEAWNGPKPIYQFVWLKLVADSETTIPGTPHSKFRCLGSQAVSASGSVAFFGSNCTTQRRGSKQDKRNAHAADPYPAVFPGIYLWSVAQEGEIEVVANPSKTLTRWDKRTEQLVGFTDPAMGSDGTVAFVALTSAGNKGVFATNPTGKYLSMLASTGEPVPGASQRMFENFPYTPSA